MKRKKIPKLKSLEGHCLLEYLEFGLPKKKRKKKNLSVMRYDFEMIVKKNLT